jgi:hypothetical protein
MAKRFPPRADAAAVACLQSFADGIAANPSMYMLSLPDSDTISRVVGEFADAYRVASNKATRSSADVLRKDQARRVAEILCQGYANRISVNHGVPTPAKLAINVNLPNPTRSRILVAQTQPTLTILKATTGEHHLRCADSASPTRASKPYGAICLEVWASTSDAPASSVDEAKSVGICSRNAITVRFEPDDNRKIATYWARWRGKHAGDVGPWSMPVSMTIAA